MNIRDTVWECPVDGCDWTLSQLDYERNRPPLRAKVTLDAAGAPQLDIGQAIVADAKHLDGMLREHLETHDVVDWLKTVQRLNQELSQFDSGIRPHDYDRQLRSMQDGVNRLHEHLAAVSDAYAIDDPDSSP
ncbi:hypothetical protein [Amycolatopsis sp. NPDC001319]|uniref:hypothetical protein n=1 Tax=unclassified Amycolatopsis TaxID=2618356 RepID=UPI0036B2B2DE